MGLWTPYLTTTELWLDSSDADSITNEPSGVAEWRDLSGHDRHFAQPDTTIRPQKTSDGLSFDGAGQGLERAPFLYTLKGYHLFLVVDGQPKHNGYVFSEINTANGESYYAPIKTGLDGDGTTADLLMFYRGENYASITGQALIETNAWDGTPKVIAFSDTDSLAGAHIDGTSNVAPTSYTRANLAPDTLFINGRGGGVAGTIKEIIVTRHSALDEHRQRIEGYLAHKWGLEANLPSDHPYKDAAPKNQLEEGGGTQSAKVSGTVQVDFAPVSRQVRAFGYDPIVHEIDGSTVTLSKSLGHATSDPDTGEYTIDLLSGYGDEIFVVVFDDYGDDFTPDMTVNVGDRVHPTTPNGHVFECTGSGTLPSEEPDWIIDTETSQLYGTASMIARVFYQPMGHGPVAPVLYDWSPAALFSASEHGAYYDPSDLSTLFQDAAGTTPVAADGDPVGLIQDKSGNGNHATQSTSASRPLYRTDGSLHWLEFDGVDDSLACEGSSTLGHNEGLTYAAMVDPIDRTDINNTIMSRGVYNDVGDWWFKRRSGLNGELSLFDANSEALSNGVPAGEAMLVTHWTGSHVIHRINGAADTTTSKSSVKGQTSDKIRIGSRSDETSPFKGKLFAAIFRGADTNSVEMANLESYLSSKTQSG